MFDEVLNPRLIYDTLRTSYKNSMKNICERVHSEAI